ncbi:eotaxin-like [Centroberyx gerrardi]|uniref:eotaxin-like n=1 Tax=Centroberyx gerrardi TaxID=166262 RepID=UPI003AAED372
MTSLAFLPLLLTAIMVSTTAAQGGLPDCCRRITSTRVQRDMLKNYHEQKPPACPIHAVVFTTEKDKRICSDPLKLWTKTTMAYLDGKNWHRHHTKPYTTTTRTISASSQEHSAHKST